MSSVPSAAGGAIPAPGATSASPTTAPAGAAAVVPKGLRENSIGLLGSTVLGVVQTAPAYSIAVTLGLLVGVVGLHAPALSAVPGSSWRRTSASKASRSPPACRSRC
jgi:hypothetical protein